MYVHTSKNALARNPKHRQIVSVRYVTGTSTNRPDGEGSRSVDFQHHPSQGGRVDAGRSSLLRCHASLAQQQPWLLPPLRRGLGKKSRHRNSLGILLLLLPIRLSSTRCGYHVNYGVCGAAPPSNRKHPITLKRCPLGEMHGNCRCRSRKSLASPIRHPVTIERSRVAPD